MPHDSEPVSIDVGNVEMEYTTEPVDGPTPLGWA